MGMGMSLRLRRIYSWQTCKNIKWKRYLTLVAGAKSHGNFQTIEQRRLNFFRHRLRFAVYFSSTAAAAAAVTVTTTTTMSKKKKETRS